MSDRFSASAIRQAYESGFRAFERLNINKNSEYLFPALDFKAILASPKPKRYIQSLAPQALYLSLKKRGLADCLDILPLLSTEQFVRICDYDIWHADRLVPQRLFHWLAYYREIDPKQMLKRFQSLDEEYQLATFAGFVKVYTPEDYERMSSEQQDELYRFPGDAFYYTIDAAEESIHLGISGLIDAAMDEDMAYAFALLSHAAYHPPQENEAMALQFRNARLEEDGFVSYDESLSCFYPLSSSEMQAFTAGRSSVGIAELISAQSHRSDFLAQVLAYGTKQLWTEVQASHLQSSFLQLANSLCTACHIETDDTQGLAACLEQAGGLIGLALEVRCQGRLEEAAQLLLAEYPKKLLRFALSLAHEARSVFLEGLLLSEGAHLRALGATLQSSYLRYKFGACLSFLDTEFLPLIGHEQTEILKGAFNRFPLVPVTMPDEPGRIVFVPLSSCWHFQQMAKFLSETLALLRSNCSKGVLN